VSVALKSLGSFTALKVIDKCAHQQPITLSLSLYIAEFSGEEAARNQDF
jgi:hypothetical protein